MKTRVLLIISACLLGACSVVPKQSRGTFKNGDATPSKFFRWSSIYEVAYLQDRLILPQKSCSDAAGTGPTYYAGPGSVYKVLQSGTDVAGQFHIVSFDRVNAETTRKPLATAVLVEAHQLYKACLAPDKVPAETAIRSGGLSTGALVVPFKIRDGDIFGDSAIGPYLAFTSERVAFLLTFGLSQVTVSDVSTQEPKAETALTYATGVIVSLPSNFDIGLVAGIDHLSGAAGDAFKYQDDPWFSFAIGFNFTTALSN